MAGENNTVIESSNDGVELFVPSTKQSILIESEEKAREVQRETFKQNQIYVWIILRS